MYLNTQPVVVVSLSGRCSLPTDASVRTGERKGVIAILAQWLMNKALPNKSDPRSKASSGSYLLSALYRPASASRSLADRQLLAALRPGIKRCKSAVRVKVGTQEWVQLLPPEKRDRQGRRRMLGSIRDRGTACSTTFHRMKGKAALSPPGQVVQNRIVHR